MEEAVDIASQVAAGLAKAHEAGMVHRDIKPANLIVTSDGVVKMLDFGLAKLAGMTKVTKTGMTVGTVAYMSPEQARGEEADARSDIWSLGAVLYEMLTGCLPFRGEQLGGVIRSILEDSPEPADRHRPDVPADLQAIVARVLQKDPQRRGNRSAGEMLRDLDACRARLAGPIPWRTADEAAREDRPAAGRRRARSARSCRVGVLGLPDRRAPGTRPLGAQRGHPEGPRLRIEAGVRGRLRSGLRG